MFGNGHNNFLSRAQRDVELFDIDIQGGGDQFSKTKFFLLRSLTRLISLLFIYIALVHIQGMIKKIVVFYFA